MFFLGGRGFESAGLRGKDGKGNGERKRKRGVEDGRFHSAAAE